jgi:acyl-[acyl-carrier-protein]-phospholipid O-acyltransferase/long-chain-fatty-acid--[acyl-carrier-protein] ligase
MTTPRRPLLGLLVAQFTNAFNDNAFKMIVTLLAIRAAQQGLTGELELEQASQEMTTRAFVVFTLPLVLFCVPAMALGDRLSKRTLIILAKAAEAALMVAGAFTLATDTTGTASLWILGLMGVQSALFAPAKYGILAEVLPHERLSAANGVLEMWSFLAIILGTVAGGILLQGTGAHLWIAGAALAVCSGIGVAYALRIPRVPAAGAREPLRDVLAGAWRAVRADRALWLAMLGSAFYWGIASLLGQDLLVYGKNVVGLSDAVAGVPLALLAIGVGAGALLAGRLSRDKVEYGLIPIGTSLLAVLCFCFWLIAPALPGMVVLMLLLGVASGFVVVPLNALLQWRAPAARRGAVIALANMMAFAGILLGSLLCHWLAELALSSRGIVLGSALITGAATVWAVWLMPAAFVRMVLVLLTCTLYRLRVVGREHVPQSGGALLVPNHVSFVDGLFLIASLDRPVRFLVEEAFFAHPLLRPFMRALGAIPITAGDGPRKVLRALRDAGKYLDDGEIVCIFAEGEISRTGQLLPFRRGLTRIAKGRDARIVPVHLDRVFGSVFAPLRGVLFRHLPKRWPVPITVSFGAPLDPTADPVVVRQHVTELAEAAAALRASDWQPLHRSFLGSARRAPLRLAYTDASGKRTSWLKASAGAVALARALRGAWSEQRRVGILLPPSVAGALANLAASLSGRASANLNYTAGPEGIAAATRQAELRTVVTSRAFLAAAKVELPEGATPIWIEDVAGGLGRRQRFTAALAALLLPKPWLERWCGAARPVRRDDVATVIFSSGSTGDPKGVVLSHANIDSNSEAVAQVMDVSRRDRLLGILPLFHSFGYLSLWFAGNHGIAVVFHPTPLDATTIGRLVERHRVTMMVATPTFLQLYLRRCTPGQLGSLRIVMAGAEKLPERVAAAFEERFGVRPLEGYGTTECAPVIATSAPDYRAPGFYQIGHRRGSVGQPLPGVAVRIVDPETGAPLPQGEAGLLLVKGTNVMQGYLGRPDLTAEVLRDGWYVTGDIALLDEDGFLFITDRMSRFSKIGGEMVPHGVVEEALHDAGGFTTQTFAVTAVPDARKGERLSVLHTADEKRIPELLEKLAARGLPALFVPKASQFLRVEKLPVLGTGKLDLRAIKRIALEHAEAAAVAE